MIEHDIDSLLEVLRSGRSLSEEDVNQLKQRVSGDPDDFKARLQLIGFARSHLDLTNCALLYEQISWFVSTSPDHPLMSNSFMRMEWHPQDSQSFDNIRSLWKSLIEREPGNLSLLVNAGYQMLINDCNLSEEYATRARELRSRVAERTEAGKSRRAYEECAVFDDSELRIDIPAALPHLVSI